MAENLLLMRQREFKNRLYRVLSILKMRYGDHDRPIREFTVSDTFGFNVFEAAKSLTGPIAVLTKVTGGAKNDENNPKKIKVR
ncbi:MAG: hypothetical protein BGO39_27975 [Chloroflexi bacterium 54-19]|nr:MAG: hypothetical protein BGO39_27975 [Chloroflexi bacterium 54-19]